MDRSCRRVSFMFVVDYSQDAILLSDDLLALCAAMVRCGAGDWRGVWRSPSASRPVCERVAEHLGMDLDLESALNSI